MGEEDGCECVMISVRVRGYVGERLTLGGAETVEPLESRFRVWWVYY